MGAGENALFEIFSIIYSCNKGALLVMDEAELGLHAKAQRLFIKKLKDVCVEMNLQVICTTHSREIFDCLPEDARFFVEAVGGKTRITSGVSSEFAFDVPPILSSTSVWSPIPYPKEIGREEAFFRRTDHRLPARSRSGHSDQGLMPAAWLQ
ncbi:AAA family ATPase [Xanthomonas euvesicatoria]|uniref:AAA family ATPase n=1 Tax=Xanthomonas euvesicatoria TaxID=456327 RepID=UPI003A101B00